MSQVTGLYATGAADSSVMSKLEVSPVAGKVPEAPVGDMPAGWIPNDLSAKERDAVIKQLNQTLAAFDTRVSLSIDNKSHHTIIKVIDNDSGKVIRQIPSEQLMKISERITELLGVIYDEKM